MTDENGEMAGSCDHHHLADAGCGRVEALFTGNILGAFGLALSGKIDDAVTKASGLNSSACGAIITIGTEPMSSIDELRRMLDLEHSSVVRMVAKLEDRGLVSKSRRHGDDNRVVRVSLTEDGKHAFGLILTARHRVLDSLMSALSENERGMLEQLIGKIMVHVVEPGDDQHYVCRLCDPVVCDQRKCPVNLAYPDLYELPQHRQFAGN